MFDGTFYLTKVDEKYRRFYAMKSGDKSVVLNPTKGLESSKTAKRLGLIEQHMTSKLEDLDSSVLRSVVVNFHKKPL